MKKQSIIMMMAAWMMVASAMAQTVTPGFEMGELIRIGYAYRKAPYLSFDIRYQYADSANPSVIREQIDGRYKMHEGRYWAMLDSTEMVQGNNYNLTVFHSDKIITVHKPQNSDDKMFQVPLMDSVFGDYVDSIHVSELCDTMRLVKIYFKRSVQYSCYEMRYNPTTYLINSMQYYIKDGQVSEEDSTSGTNLIKVFMCNYSENVISEDYFMESKFIYKDGAFYKRPDYSDYELIVDGNF